MDFPVTISPDISLHAIIMSPHNYLSGSTGVYTPGPAGLDAEAAANMWWPPGALFNKAKFTKTVKHRNLTIMLEDHDLGPLLLHVPLIPIPDNVLSVALHTIKSSRKTMFSAGEVQANGAPIGCVTLWPPTPMLTCGNPVPAPYAISPTNFTNTVRVGLSGWDLAAGWVAIAVEAIRTIIRSASPGSNTSHPIADALAGGQADLRDTFVDSIFSGANARAAVRAIGRATDDYHGPVQFSVKQGQGMLGEHSATVGWSDQGVQSSYGAEYLNGLAGGQIQAQRNDDGGRSLTGQVGGPFGTQAGSEGNIAQATPGNDLTWF